MITINDNSVPQINAALLRLESSITQGMRAQVRNIDADFSSDINALKKKISELTVKSVYKPGDHINISSNGVISVIDVDKTLTIKRNGTEIGTFTALATENKEVDISVPEQVQSDWQETDTSSPAYILHKPTLPSAQIQSDWTQTDVNAVDYIKHKPTELSDFTNDVGYITGDYIQPELFLCTTAYSTAAKVATSAQASTNFSLVDGRVYQVFISRGNGDNNSTAVTMKLNNAPAIPVYLGDHVLALTRQFPIPQGIYYFYYHAATSTTEAYFRIYPATYNFMDGYQLLGNYISVYNTQYHFNRNFIFILHAQTQIGTTVTLMDWAGSQTTAKIIINGNTTAGLQNPRTYFCYFHYDETNGHKVYTSTDWSNVFGLTGDSGNAGKLNIQLYNHLITYGGQYKTASANNYGLDLNNSDIIGINGLYTADTAGGYSEGINFYRDTTHNDSIYANGGHFYFGSNVQTYNTKGSETTGAQNSDATLHAASFVGNALYAPNFTFVIDSNAALAAWANATAGNDYTSVLIKKGEWSLSVTSSAIVINLTTAGTKVVVGEAGSKLILSGAVTGNKYGLNYSTRTYAPDCWMHNVNVTMTGGASNNRAYSGCGHLTNCTGTVTGGTTTALFYNCDFLEYCEGTASGGSSSNYVFQGCYGVRYCRGSAISSYYSLTTNSTYAYANTLNGGWNTPL